MTSCLMMSLGRGWVAKSVEVQGRQTIMNCAPKSQFKCSWNANLQLSILIVNHQKSWPARTILTSFTSEREINLCAYIMQWMSFRCTRHRGECMVIRSQRLRCSRSSRCRIHFRKCPAFGQTNGYKRAARDKICVRCMWKESYFVDWERWNCLGGGTKQSGAGD